MPGALWINDVDVSEYGVVIGRGYPGHLDLPEIDTRSTSLPGRAGHVSLVSEPPYLPRRLSFDGHMEAVDLATLLANREALKALVGGGIVRIRTGDQPNWEFFGVGRVTFSPIGAWQTDLKHQLAITFRCDDPLCYDRVDTIVDFSGGAQQCPMGSGGVSPVVRVGGGGTNPVVVHRTHLGVEVGRMEFTIALASSQYLEIDCEGQTVIDQAGTRRDDLLTLGDFLALRPVYDAGLDGPYQTIEMESGVGSLAEIQYRKSHL